MFDVTKFRNMTISFYRDMHIVWKCLTLLYTGDLNVGKRQTLLFNLRLESHLDRTFWNFGRQVHSLFVA